MIDNAKVGEESDHNDPVFAAFQNEAIELIKRYPGLRVSTMLGVLEILKFDLVEKLKPRP